MNIFYHFGRYFMLIKRVFGKPEKRAIYRDRIFEEINSLGIGSLGIVAIISVFMGAVITIQTAFNFESPLIPPYAIGVAVRDTMMLEFSPAIVSLILAGKIGSNIASEIGSMRITEQIDALEIMGINSAGYLILPKIAAGVLIMPFLIAISMFLGILGGYVMGIATGACSSYEYIFGIQAFFDPTKLYYSFTKVITFAFLITSISSYFGYYTHGGALEVGKSSTSAVVYSSILILIFNFLLTQLFLT